MLLEHECSTETARRIARLLRQNSGEGYFSQRLAAEFGGCTVTEALGNIAAEFEREVAERFLKLPVDADGVPINAGDRLTEDDTCLPVSVVHDVKQLRWDYGSWVVETSRGEFRKSDFAKWHHLNMNLDGLLDGLINEVLEYGNGSSLHDTEILEEIRDKYASMLQLKEQ